MRQSQSVATFRIYIGLCLNLLCSGYRVSFPGVNGLGGVAFATHPHLAPVLKSKTTPLLPLRAFIACSRASFTLYWFAFAS